MPGLEKFEASEVWRANFKKFLFMERKPDVVKSTGKAKESARFSLDIGEDLKNIIEQKKKKKAIQLNLNTEIVNISNNTTKSSQRSDSNISMTDRREPMFQKTSNESFDNTRDDTDSDTDSTNNILVWQKTSDESFEALEKMCDKTASDPNSTLFQYLHTDRREQVLAEVKKRSADGKIFEVLDQEDNLLRKISNCTLLDDIEAPSRMWENTVCSESILQTSPVKTVGLLRPSTILEETPDDSSNSYISSPLSFITATKSIQSDVSSTYETADDFPIVSRKCQPQELLVKKELKQGDDIKNSSSFVIKENTLIEDIVRPNNSVAGTLCRTSEEPVDLIELEKTFTQPYISISEKSQVGDGENIKALKNVQDDSIIDLLSDDECEIADDQNICCDMGQMSYNIKSAKNNSHDACSFNECYDTTLAEANDPQENSIQFNDTMEEVEYMLKKGMEYMATKGVVKKSPKDSSFNRQSFENIPNSSVNLTTLKNMSSTIKGATSVKKTTLSKEHSATLKRFDIDIRPFPKLEIFAKPTMHARTKEITGKQQKFSHIISPIGTYMKKTAQTPLMSSIRCKKKNDYFNSTAVQDLEIESRLYKPEFNTDITRSDANALPKLPGIISEVKRGLPKKAYISSDFKHIIDERTPVTIPGTKKIQKYLENAMIPAVLRHEGKVKIPTEITNKLTSPTSSMIEPASKLPLKGSDTNSKVSMSTSNIRKLNNASLADLSVMSGDVSMYTIMDAQKF